MSIEAGWIGAEDDAKAFWAIAASFLGRGLGPRQVLIKVRGATRDLFAAEPAAPSVASPPPRGIPSRARTLLDRVLLHRDPERFQLAYRLLWRLRTTPALLDVASDPDVVKARTMEKAVGRDMHKMTAFVRFRAVDRPGRGPVYVAWFEPDHFIVEATAPFFRDRFSGMSWSILTPHRSAHWDGAQLTLAGGARRQDAPGSDPLETLWQTYYAHIFNPARLMPKAMQAQMPKKYWHNLPEAPLIAPLIASARKRAETMIAASPTTPHRRIVPYAPPHRASLGGIADQLSKCTRCPLHCHATQAVAGEGPADARLMIVGEQPGHEEDLAGRPFVGPAGRLLDIALQRTAIDRGGAFVTNAVKHFKYEARGKHRLHKSPDASEIDHCRWWLSQELGIVKPSLVLTLGVTAARGVLGEAVALKDVRAQPIPLVHGMMLATVHPSYLLRLRDEAQKREEWHRFLADLRMARDLAFSTRPEAISAGPVA